MDFKAVVATGRWVDFSDGDRRDACPTRPEFIAAKW
jgi:hypothetical protein